MHQTSGGEVLGSNPAPLTMILMRGRIIVSKKVEKLRVDRETYTLEEKKIEKIITEIYFFLFLSFSVTLSGNLGFEVNNESTGFIKKER